MARRSRYDSFLGIGGPLSDPGPMDAIAASALQSHALRNAMDLGLVGRGVHRSPLYFARLLAEGHTTDPATGLPIPGAQAPIGVVGPGTSPVTINNPFAAPTSAPLTPEGIAAAQERNARQQRAIPFAEVQQQFQDLLIGRATSPLTGGGAVASLTEGLSSQTQQGITDALRPHFAARDKQAAADAIAVLKAASEPGVFGSDIANMKQQFAAKYPEYVSLLDNLDRPMSREQIQQIEDAQQTEQFRDNFEAMGMPRDMVLGIERDKDGNVKPHAPMAEMWFRAQTEGRKQAFEEGRETRALASEELRQLEKDGPPEPINTLTGAPLFDPDTWDKLSSDQKETARLQQEGKIESWKNKRRQLTLLKTGNDDESAIEAANPMPETIPPVERAQAEGVQHFQPESKDEITQNLLNGTYKSGAIIEWEGESYTVEKTTSGRIKLFPLQ